jgi:hypothetical protein
MRRLGGVRRAALPNPDKIDCKEERSDVKKCIADQCGKRDFLRRYRSFRRS